MPTHMLNKVQIEGLVARESWNYHKELFFRIASYRDTSLLNKPDIVAGRDKPNSVNAHYSDGVSHSTLADISLEKVFGLLGVVPAQ